MPTAGASEEHRDGSVGCSDTGKVPTPDICQLHAKPHASLLQAATGVGDAEDESEVKSRWLLAAQVGADGVPDTLGLLDPFARGKVVDDPALRRSEHIFDVEAFFQFSKLRPWGFREAEARWG